MPKKILYVEDDEDTQNLVSVLLKNNGFVVLTAYNGVEGLKRIDENNFDIVLLDVMLPDISGWDLFGKIRKNPKNKNVKVAFLSVIPVSDERLEVLKKNGVADYITKPFDNEDLVKRIKQIVD